MRKLLLYFVSIIFMLFSAGMNGQNLVQNGDLESWDDPNNPTNWDKIESISQEDVNVHGGTYSAMHTSADATTDFMQDVEGVSPGTNYTIRYFYYDNDPTARTRIWSYWTSGGSTLPDHEAELRPGSYSSDQDEWVMYEVDLTSPPSADGFRFEVRVYKQDGNYGGPVYYDDFSIEAASVDPEPTNYPADFQATANELSIELSWTDAIGEQLPGGYLILASVDPDIAPPVDGEPVANDPEFTDGEGALNVAYGEESAVFDILLGNTTIYFEIYPYTNGGANIDYKTDGDPPAAEATTANLVVLNYENFNDSTLGTWMQYSVLGDDQYWEVQNYFGINDSPQAKMSGYSGGAVPNDDWLISPEIALFPGFSNPTLEFWTAKNFDGPELEVKLSLDYDGSGDPSAFTWTDLDAVLSAGGWEWTYSGEVYLGDEVPVNEPFYVAFRYTSNDSEASTWELDEIMITAEPSVGMAESTDENFARIYPNPVYDQLNIEIEGNEKVQVEIFNIAGKLMVHEELTGKLSRDLSGLPSGLYLLRITGLSNGKSYQQKILLR